MEWPLASDSSLQPRVKARLACAALLATPASVPSFAFFHTPDELPRFIRPVSSSGRCLVYIATLPQKRCWLEMCAPGDSATGGQLVFGLWPKSCIRDAILQQAGSDVGPFDFGVPLYDADQALDVACRIAGAQIPPIESLGKG